MEITVWAKRDVPVNNIADTITRLLVYVFTRVVVYVHVCM